MGARVGIMEFASKGNYKGQWKDGKSHGKGAFVYPNGDVYDGEWKDGLKDGKGSGSSNVLGVMEYNNKDKYEGEWKADRKHGNGMCFAQGARSLHVREWG